MSARDDAADFKAQIVQIKAKFAARARGTHFALYKAIVKSCLLVERTAKIKMTQTTTTTFGTGKHDHAPSLPGFPPAVDTGMLRNSITHVIEGTESNPIGYVGSVLKSPPYGSYLETGTSKMKPRPWLVPSMEESKDQIKEWLSDAVKGKSNASE